ncbi:restriction endonuclease subunit S [Mammaliicoccus sciuri]
MNEKKLVPRRRFEEFQNADAWEQRKIVDIAPLQRGFDLPVSEREAGLYPVIMSNGIGAYHSKYKAKAPGVVTGRSGTIGNLTFVETDYWPHNTALWVTDFKDNDAKYIYYLYQKLDLKRYSTGSGVPTLNRNDVHDTATSIPSFPEQKKISRLFSQLDNLITLHKRKLEKTKALKSAYLAEMFPAEGERVPKRRFAGFNGEWKQTRLEELAEVRTGKAFSSLDFNDDGEYLVITNKNVQDQENDRPLIGDRINLKNKSIINDYLLNGINVLVTMDGVNIGDTGKIKHGKAVLAQRVGRLNSDQIEFVYQITKRNKFTFEMNKVSVGNAIKHISLKQIAEYSFLAPVLKEEQKAIGEFFKKMDDSIRNQQQKLKKLKAMKQAYLAEMFV